MGSFGVQAFDNDAAGDWADQLEYVDDLSLVEAALREVEDAGVASVPSDVACRALAACEVLARLQGNAGYHNASSEPVDRWVVAHQLEPSAALLERADAAIDRVLGPGSQMRTLREESGTFAPWREAIEDLRERLRAKRVVGARLNALRLLGAALIGAGWLAFILSFFLPATNALSSGTSHALVGWEIATAPIEALRVQPIMLLIEPDLFLLLLFPVVNLLVFLSPSVAVCRPRWAGCLVFLLVPTAMLGRAIAKEHTGHLFVGYYVWMASFLVLAVGFVVLNVGFGISARVAAKKEGGRMRDCRIAS